MRTQLHEARPPKRGRWESAPTIHPWRRIAIAIAIIFAVMLAVTFFATNNAEAARGITCKTSSRSDRHATVGGVPIGRATWIATGCYFNDHSAVKSLSLTVREDYTNAPFEFAGMTSQWREGVGHMQIRGARVRWNFCLPLAGCVPAGSAAWQVAFDAYGNWGWRIP